MKRIILALSLMAAFAGDASAQRCWRMADDRSSIVTTYLCSDGSEYQTNRAFGTIQVTRQPEPPPVPYTPPAPVPVPPAQAQYAPSEPRFAPPLPAHCYSDIRLTTCKVTP